MKKLLMTLLLPTIFSCGNGNPAKSSGVDSVTVDSSFSPRVLIDTSTSNKMNADTTGMGEAR